MMISFTKIKMDQIQQIHDQYINPLSYFANTPRSINRRKYQATRQSNMKIVNFTHNTDNSFEVIIKGNRGITYDVFFSEHAITCSCPDFQKHTVKPICKHMFKLICLSENQDILNNSMLLTDLMNPQHLERILTSILRIIDIKKMERYGGPKNQISIERDEYCPICYGDFDENISTCSKCKHVFHTQCVRLSWNSAAYNARGRCPMCRELNSFPELHGGNRNYDPWEIYNFPPPPPAPVPEEQDHSFQEVPEVQVEPDISIENLPVQQQQPQDELVEENNEHYFPNGNILNVENEDDLLLPESVDNPFMAHHHHLSNEDGAGQAPNENSDGAIASDSQTQLNSLSEHEDYELIDRRIKILNVSLFILETINIIFNDILYSEDRPN
jgi:hypothetical protein